MNDIQTVETAVAISEDYNELANKYLSTCGQNIPVEKATEFIELAKALQLNPFKREVYLVGYKDKYNIITGYEVYLKRAERTGKLNGWNYEIAGSIKFTSDGKLDPSSDMRAKITIYRKDWEHPFSHIVYIAECIQTKYDGAVNSMWKKMPSLMLRKVAIGQGFRLCFPDELGGMPYAEGELPQDDEEKIVNVTPKTEEIPEVKTESKIVNVTAETVEQKPMNNTAMLSIDCFNQLSEWVNVYAKQLNINTPNGNPYALAKHVLDTGTDEEIIEMFGRMKKFLSACGVRV